MKRVDLSYADGTRVSRSCGGQPSCTDWWSPGKQLANGRAIVVVSVCMLIHCVYFWFKADADPAVVARFEDGLRRLTSIPGIQTAYFGRPESTPKRPVIDDSYAWGVIETFADLAAHDRYQDHEIHHEFLREFSSSWERVQVYDVRV